VLRFPPAASEAHYKRLIAECKRVLRPAGFIEVSVLDLDLLGMGSQTRKGVRALKCRIQAAAQASDDDATDAVSLKPMSDLIVRMLGRRGFEGLRRGVVGVPVVGGVEGREEVGEVGRWWWGRCYEDYVADVEEAGSLWDDAQVLKECETMATRFRLMVAYAQKGEGVQRRTVSV
jgi:hypothetical protein